MEAPRPDKSIASQPTSTGMPSISEDELAGEADEPPDHRLRQPFTKTAPPPFIRRPSLLTKALHTDTESHSESHDESLGFSSFNRQASRSSTCSTWSGKSDFTSDDGLASNMSSPSNKSTGPLATMAFRQLDFGGPAQEKRSSGSTSPGASRDGRVSESAQTAGDLAVNAASPKIAVEDTLGRKRCISFACGRRDTKPEEKADATTSTQTKVEEKAEVKKRPCMLKFACPSKISWKGLDKENQAGKSTRHESPPPPSPAPFKGRQHRDSDTTIRNESPKTSRKVPSPELSVPEDQEPERSDPSAFHEFASTDEPVEEWVQESTCHRSRLTVQDTLKKENDIRQIGEEAEEEALEEEDEAFEAASDGLDSDEDDMSDAGFHSDDEDGFAESDDDSEGDSDYEWWAPRKSSGIATMAPADGLRPPARRSNSDSSMNSMTSPRYRDTPKRKSRTKPKSTTEALPIRPATPELPDSTDFVCGTLDEDRPLEQAYASCIEQRKAAKHIARPQDIDPTFPTDLSGSDEEDEVSDMPVVYGAREHHTEASLIHGSLEDMHGESTHRGRKSPAENQRATHLSPAPPRLTKHDVTSPPANVDGRRRSPAATIGTTKRLKSPPPPTTSKRLKSPPPPIISKRLKSPPPPNTTSSKRQKSPAPHVVAGAVLAKSNDTQKTTTATRGRALHTSPPSRLLFGHSPRRHHSPKPAQRLTSPPPSRRGSPPGFVPQTMMFGTAFLGHRPQLTHTTSLPRSPNPLARRHGHLTLTPRRTLTNPSAPFEDDDPTSEDDIDKTPHNGLATTQSNYAAASDDDNDNNSSTAEDEEASDEEASGNDTAREAATPTASTYTRGAIDIVQGLERKRLRRRMKFHERYCRKEERKLRNGGGNNEIGGRAKRPVPGRGAERMRQVGIECALYRGKRVLSV